MLSYIWLVVAVHAVLVSCQCPDPPVRLVDGDNLYQGRVEICINNEWKTVCDENFSANDATVICRELGYSTLNAHAYGDSYYGSNEDLDIGITELTCSGTEDSWTDCTYSQSVASCSHSDDAGVSCSGSVGTCEGAGFTDCCVSNCNQGGCYCDSFCYTFNDCCDDIVKTCPQSECETGALRLVNDITPADIFNGRVELCIDGQYGGICDSSWDNNDAAVVCNQWGDYTPSASVASVDSLYGQPGVSFVATDFQCSGSEDTLTDCTYTASSDCGQHNGAGAYCTLLCDDGDMRLVNGSDNYGRVEICKDLLWHPICDLQWSNKDANVVCNQLGLSTVGHAYGDSLYGGGFNEHIYTNVVCNGDEDTIDDCAKSTNIPDTCTPATSAGVVCDVPIPDGCKALGHTDCCLSACYQPAGACYCDSVCHTFNDCCEDIEETCPSGVSCTDGDTRVLKNDLVAVNEGRVEICKDGDYKSVCETDWDVNDATVVCRTLGLGLTGVEAIEGGVYGQSTLDIIGGLSCNGDEQTLLDATCAASESVDCGHHEDAGVRCPLLCDNEGDIRLADGPSEYEGRLEVCTDGQWSSVCADDSFCTDTATVVCRQLGYSLLRTEAYGNASYGRGFGLVAAENIQCNGDEDSITDCTYDSGSTCPHEWDAGVKCYPQSPCEAAGHTGCCTSNCYNFLNFCWCDSSCYIFNDCCDNIETTCPQSVCLDGEMQFADGTESNNGRLEICVEGAWQTVCENSFDTDEAILVCKNLGYSAENYTIYQPDVFGQGTGDIIAKTFDCSGNENDLNTCPGESVCCGHHRDIGLSCAPACSEGQIRLVDGSNDMEGRVEVCYGGRWGTVCDDLWDTKNARVACKQAGLPWRGAIARGAEYFPSGIGPIFLDNVDCDGTEDTLWACPANAVESHNCVHYEDAGVTCAPGPCEQLGYTDSCCTITGDNTCQGIQDKVCHCDLECDLHNDCCIDTDLLCKCNEGDIRLVGGIDNMEGRVEICSNGQYGTVCDDFWGTDDATVVCRQLGLPTLGAEAFSFSYFGQGTGEIWLDNVQCDGTENALINCTHNGVGNHNCVHFEDAGVRCNDPECTHGAVRLVGGCSEYEGRLEVCVDGQWGTVCDDQFSTVDAQVVCKSLGFPHEGAIFIQYAFIYFGSADGLIHLDDVQCDGTEEHILDCDYTSDHNCAHFEDVGIRCDSLCQNEGELRLVSGAANDQGVVYQGRVEICLNGNWGTICDDQYDVNDARAICRQLGLPTESARAYHDLQFGRGFGEIHYSELGCTGNETHVFDCPKQTSFFCSHFEDIGVSCEGGCTDGQVRLVNAETCDNEVELLENEGRVEICKDGSWGTICDDTDTFGTSEARVACKNANQPYSAAQVFNPSNGPDPIQYSNVDCDGDEDDLGDCSKNANTDCTNHNFDVGVTCQESCNSGELRLVDGTDQTNGRLEICIGGLWGTVCDEDFENVDARVTCKQLGLSYEGAEALYGGTFGIGDDHVALTSLYCTGNENQLIDCIFKTGSAVDCAHANDVGVVCQDLCCDGDIRLASGEGDNSGRVEVCFNGQWGTVCDTAWTTEDAQVACYQLGYERTPVRTFGGSKYGPGFNDVYFTNLQCLGTEDKLVSCLYDFDTSECDHSHDAGLRCDGALRDVDPGSLSCLPSVSCSDCYEDIKSPTDSPNTNPGPSVVTNSTYTVVNSTSAVITWDTPMQPNGIITGYCVYVEDLCNSPARTWSFDLKGTDPRRVALNSLVGDGRPFTYYIRPTNYHRCGDVVTATFSTAQNVPVDSPIITGERTSDYTMTLNWMPLSYCDTRGELAGYKLRWGVYSTRDSSSTILSLSADTTSIVLPGGDDNLIVYQPYSVEIAAENGAGVGPYSEVIIVPATNSTDVSITIQLTDDTPCGRWTADDTDSKIADVNNQITQVIREDCNCDYTADHLYGGAFSCDSNDDTVATYTVSAYISPDTTTDGIAAAVDSWSNSNPTIEINGVSFAIGQPDEGSQAGLIAGVVIAVVAFIVIVIAIVIVLVVIFRHTRIKYRTGEGYGDDVVGYSNRMAFPEGQGEDNISQHMGSTVHDDDFQEAINMISEDIEKQKVAEYDTVPPSGEHVYFGQK